MGGIEERKRRWRARERQGGGGGGWREKGGIEGERGGKWRESHYYHFLSNSPFPLSPAARLQQLKPPCVSVWWVGIVGIVGEGKGRMGAASFPIFPHINHTKCSFDRKYHAGEG